MSTPLVLLICALLFAAFGLVMRRQRKPPGCGTCSSACPSTAGRGPAAERIIAPREDPRASRNKESRHA